MAGGAAARQEEQRILVLFRLAGEHYGIDVGCVREIITWQEVTRVPRTPPFVEGIINLRGHIIPVLDLRRRFGLAAAERDRATRIVVVEIGTAVVGLVVDAVSEVLRLPGEAIEPPAEILAVDATFIEGIARSGDRLILVLQPDRILAPVELEALQAVGSGAGSGADADAGAAAGSVSVGESGPEPGAGSGSGSPAGSRPHSDAAPGPDSDPSQGTPGGAAEADRGAARAAGAAATSGSEDIPVPREGGTAPAAGSAASAPEAAPAPAPPATAAGPASAGEVAPAPGSGATGAERP